MQKQLILQTAQGYLNKGYSVIPVTKEKKPLIKWTKYQTELPAIEDVVDWTTQFPDMQLAIVTGTISDLVVIDVEKGGDVSQFPETLTVATGGGGFHLYYKHPGTPVKNNVRIAELVDIRGDGGLVVAPPSESSKGVYSWMNDPETTELALYPVELVESLSQVSSEKLVQTGERNSMAAQKAGEILAKLPQLENRLQAWEQLKAWNIAEVAEPLSEAELQKVFNSIASREETKYADDQLVLKPFTLRDLYAEEFPPIEWLAQDLLPVGMLGAITGESNAYKSFLTLALAQSIATGTPFLNHFAVKQGKVLIVDEENNRRIIEKRFKDMGVEAHDNIVFLSQSGIKLDNKDHLQKLKMAVDEINPVLVVLDSLVRFHSRDENSASEMRHVMDAIKRLVSEKRSVVFIHHHKKEQGGGKSSGVNSVRGSTDIFNALDCHIGIKRNTNTVTVAQHKLRVQQELAPFNVSLDILGEHLKFVYGGEDTSRQDLLEATKTDMKVMLHEAAGEEMTRKELISGTNASNKIGTEALRVLVDNEEISYRVGPHGMHLYKLGTQPEEVIVEDEIPY
jgi:hypothetical protein